ncbi:MAG: hypothetical protein EOM52_05165 [Clostridia bacterium]|nr:hypothetical protein [Clostridia bacterium]
MEHGLPEEDRHCAHGGSELYVTGKETRQELVIIQVRAKIREHVRLK